MDRKQCLDEAIKIVTKDRQNDYGTPEKNFGTIAEYWTAYLHSRGINGIIKDFDVAAMMSLLKIARVASSPHKDDNWVDLAGYAANGAELIGNWKNNKYTTVTIGPSAFSATPATKHTVLTDTDNDESY